VELIRDAAQGAGQHIRGRRAQSCGVPFCLVLVSVSVTVSVSLVGILVSGS